MAAPAANGVAPKRVIILGAGGIGSVVGGLLAHSGHEVTLTDPWHEHIQAIVDNGLLVRTTAKDEEVLTRPKALHFKDLSGNDEQFDMGFVAVNACVAAPLQSGSCLVPPGCCCCSCPLFQQSVAH